MRSGTFEDLLPLVAMALLAGLNGPTAGRRTLFTLPVAALVSARVVSLRRPWTRIVVRVAGSWIAAIGLLLLGWTLSGRI